MTVPRERLGLVVYHGIESGAQLAGYARSAEEAGFDSVWVTERYFHEETFSMLGHLAASTSRMDLGVGVVNPFTRDPALTAMAAATVHRLSGGRMVLGLGRSERRIIGDRLGIGYEGSMDRLECAVRTIRDLLAGREVRAEGGSGPFRLAGPALETPPPIYLAAIGPKALDLAGAVGDGVILNAYSPVGYIEWAASRVRRAAERAGRSPDSVDIACMLVLRLTDDPAPLMPGLRRRVARLLAEPGMGPLLLGQGGLDVGVSERVKAADPAGESDGAAAGVPEDLVEKLYVIGDADRCTERIEEYRRAGVTCPLILPRLGDLERACTLLRSGGV